MKDIEFFGPVDRKEGKEDGVITSEYPAWMHKYQIEEMEESISRKERELKRNAIPFEHVAAAEEELKREKAKMKLIKKSEPKLNAADKDDLHKAYKSIGKEIGDAQFTYSEMMLGTASAHDEADRMVEKRIPMERAGLSPEMAEQLNIRHEKGKVSRDDLSKAFKVYGHLLGEPTNVEVLRRDKVTQRTGGRPKKS